MILEIGSKGFVGPSIFWPLKMGLKRRKVENHCSRDLLLITGKYISLFSMSSTGTRAPGSLTKKHPQNIFLSGSFTVWIKCSSRSFSEQRTKFALNSYTKK